MTRNALSPAGETFAVLDPNVLIPPRLSDILFDLALAGLYYPHWTAAIEAELVKNWAVVIGRIVQDAPIDPRGARRRLECFRAATKGGYEVLGYTALESQVPGRVDPKDRHVVAAGLALRKYSDVEDQVFLISSNVRHLAKRDMRQLGVTVVRPGEFIDLLYLSSPVVVETAMLKVVNELQNPPYAKDALLKTLRLYEATKTADGLAGTWSKPRPAKKRAARRKAQDFPAAARRQSTASPGRTNDVGWRFR